jgi:WD40 repeat protein
MIKKPIFILALAGAFHGAALSAADIRFEGPVSAYYFDPSSAGIRAMVGVPGAAHSAAVPAANLDAVWIAPNGRMALALRQGALVLLPDVGGDAAAITLGNVGGSVDRVAWSGDSAGAAVYSAGSNVLRVITQLAQNPAMGPAMDLSPLGGAILNLRMSRGSANIAAAVDAGASSSLYLFSTSGLPARIQQVSDAGAMEFSSDGQNLFVVDKSVNRIVNLPVADPASAAGVTLMSPEQSPSDFTDLAVSPDGKSLYAVQAKSRTACSFEISTGKTASCETLDFTPSGIQRVSGSLYLLNSSDGGKTVWLLDSRQNKIYFVPSGDQN